MKGISVHAAGSAGGEAQSCTVPPGIGIQPVYPLLKIEMIAEADLAVAWRNTRLSGHFWRIYHNRERGAGVYIAGKKLEMLPEKIYLIAPLSELPTYFRGHIRQTYLHFESNQLVGNPRQPVREISLTEDLAQLFASLEMQLACGGGEWTMTMTGFQLISKVLAALSPDCLCEGDSDAALVQVINHLRNSPEDSFALEKLAREAGMPLRDFLRKFRKTTGLTPYQYLLSIRYTAAARLLKESSLTIPEICERIGVNDRFHFSRRFKLLYGLPPAAYRKQAAVPVLQSSGRA